jgi:thymidylate synthase (FAD)
MNKPVTILTGAPIINVIAEQKIAEDGVLAMAEWVRQHRPDCVPNAIAGGFADMFELLPHGRWEDPHPPTRATRQLSDNEILCEIAGRKCYDSFAEKAGKKTNKDYFDHIVSMDPMHASILYHAKMTFFFAGVSRKFSHQFIRNYVGSDRDEEGSPSQESTRFTHHYGFYVAPPLMVESGVVSLDEFKRKSQRNYDDYNDEIDALRSMHPDARRKEIYEAAAGLLNMSAETSFVWTTNPMAIRKFLKERCHGGADAEIRRFAVYLGKISFARWPNLFLGKDLDGVRDEVETYLSKAHE